MAQKRNLAPRIIEISDEEEEQESGKSSSDGGEDESEEVGEDDEEEVEEGDEEEVEDGDEEEVEDDEEEVEEEEVEDGDEEEVEEEEVEDGDEEEVEEVDEEHVEEDDDYVEEKEEEFSSKESIRKLLEPFGRDKLVEIFKEAALKNSALLSRVVSYYDSDPAHRKIFVHGLAADATSDAISAAFSPFGQIENCHVIANLQTGLCKGYAFVLFKSRAAAMRALKDPLKQIGSRTTNCHLASSGPQAAGGKSSSENSGRKIIVNNVSNKLKPEDLRTFFSKFGEIEEGPLGHDPVSGKLRGFAFFIYKTVEGCKKALEEPKKRFEGCEMHCRMAFEGDKMNNNTLMTALAGTKRMSSALRANDLTKKYSSAATLMGHNSGPAPTTGMGHNSGPAPTTGMGQNLSSGPTLLAGQNFGPVPTTLMGQNISRDLSSFVGQNGRSGYFNLAPALSPALSVGGGVTPAQSYGVVSANRGSGLGPNDISSSVINKYGTLSALYGMGAYQNSTSTTALKPQSGVGSLGTSRLPPFFGL